MPNIKIYARQIALEYQESPLTWGDFPENVYIYGNRRYKERGGDYIKNIKNSMYDAADELKALPRGGSYYDSFIDILADIIPAPENKKEYTRADRLKWRALLLNFDAGAISDDDALTAALELITGEKYDHACICGCCQGDWQHIAYPARYGDSFRETFETEYFNTGSEWIIHDGDDAPEEPDDINGYSLYCYSYDPRAEIAKEHGVNPDDVILYEFGGYTHHAIYKAV